jgi:hypothetical protein
MKYKSGVGLCKYGSKKHIWIYFRSRVLASLNKEASKSNNRVDILQQSYIQFLCPSSRAVLLELQ